MKLTLPLLLLSAAMLTACTTRPVPIRITSDACAVLKPLDYHDDPADPKDVAANEIDTPDTIKKIQSHNAKLKTLCPQLFAEGA